MKKIIQKCFLTLIFLGGICAVFAQAPTTSAPTPTHAASDVISFFSDHYLPGEKVKEPSFPGWGGDNPVSITTIAGTNDQVFTSSGNSHIVYTSGWEGQTKGTIHMDVYSVDGGEFRFGLGIAFSNDLKFPDIEWPILQAGQWNTVEVPVVEFVKAGLDDSQNLQTIRFSAKGAYYIDNIYAFGPKEEYVEPVDIPVAPVPTHNPEEVKSAFSDSYTPAVKDVLPLPYGGNQIAKVMCYKDKPEESVLRLLNLGNSAVNISTWNISGCNYIHIDVYYTGESGDGSFYFGLNSADWGGKDFKYINDFTWPQTIAGQWVSMDIPLTKFRELSGLNLGGIIMIKFEGSGSFYVDNLYAYEIPLEINPPATVPTFTLQAENVRSIFCEQYEEAGYQDSEWGMTDIDANGNLMDYGQNRDQDREFVEIVEGNQTIRLTNWNDYPFKIHRNSEVMDLSDMDYLHASVYLMSGLDDNNKPATVTFMMHEKDGGNVHPTGALIPMQTGQWVSFSIPLCHYRETLDLTKAYVLRLRLGGYPGMEVYLDNVFAYKGNPIGVVAQNCEDEPAPGEPIFDKSAGTLPPVDQPYLGVNLASASGGTVPGVMGTNYVMPKNEDLWYFKAKGVRLIRFPFRWKRVQREAGGPLVESEINAMKEVVKEAERLGIWVMLDMHDYAEYTRNDTLYTLDGRYRVKNANDAWGPWKTTPEGTGVGMREFADVWAKLAGEFKGFSNMWGYDLMNEPKDVDIEGMKNSYQLVINEVRKIDTRTAIVIEGKNYASASAWPTASDALKDLTDPNNNIIYQAHTYFDKDNSGTYRHDYDTEIGTNSEIYKQRLDPFLNWLEQNNKRGMLGEFGVPYNGAQHSDPRYMDLIDNVFAYLKEKKLTATYWCAGTWYDTNHLTVQPAKDYYTEKSTMKIMEKYTWDFSGTGIHEAELKNNDTISLYPNPVTSTLTISTETAINSVCLFNLIGQKVLERRINSSVIQYTIDLSEYPTGNYLLQIETKDGVKFTRKILKQ